MGKLKRASLFHVESHQDGLAFPYAGSIQTTSKCINNIKSLGTVLVNSLKHEVHLNIILNFSPYRKENTTRVRYKEQLVNAA
jgi:hypothetical protein